MLTNLIVWYRGISARWFRLWWSLGSRTKPTKFWLFWSVLLLLSLTFLVIDWNQFGIEATRAEAGKALERGTGVQNELLLFGGNTLAPLSQSYLEPVAAHKIRVVVTAYSSTPWETDDTPYITASGAWVKDGIVAANFLPFGTRIRIPEIYGDEIFEVKDRMHPRIGYQVDIWFPSYWEAKNFGAQKTYIEVLES